MKYITYEHATQLYHQGISVFPALVNGSKKPKGRWKQYQSKRCTPRQLRQWFKTSSPLAIAVVCGRISNNLLVIDIDDANLIEPFESRLTVRFRVDGVLREVLNPPRQLAPRLISRVKVMAKLDIAEKRVPQDGRFRLRMPGKTIDFRISIMPSVHGEDAVIRILDKETISEQFRLPPSPSGTTGIYWVPRLTPSTSESSTRVSPGTPR